VYIIIIIIMRYLNTHTHMMHGIYQRVGVHEDTLGELCKSPAVQLREGHAKVRPIQKVKVDVVVAVEHVDRRLTPGQTSSPDAACRRQTKVKGQGHRVTKCKSIAVSHITLHYKVNL